MTPYVGWCRTPLGRWLVCALLACLLNGWAPQARAAPTLSADIAPGPVSGALADFARQTGLQLVYVSEIAQGRTSGGSRAGTAPALALSELLEGTGLAYTFVNDRTVRIYILAPVAAAPRIPAAQQPPALAQPLDEVIVLASRGGERVRDVPLSLLVWSADAIASAGAKGLEQLAAMTPSVEYDFNTAVGAGISTNLSIRV